MRAIWWATGGAVAGAVLVWLLATWHHFDLLPEDLQAALSALLGGVLSFGGGYAEHLRAERAARNRTQAAPTLPESPPGGQGGTVGPGGPPGP